MTAVIDRGGYSCRARDVPEALAVVRSSRPDLVTVELRVPEAGLALCEAIRRNAATVPIMVVTTEQEIEHWESARAAGADLVRRSIDSTLWVRGGDCADNDLIDPVLDPERIPNGCSARALKCVYTIVARRKHCRRPGRHSRKCS